MGEWRRPLDPALSKDACWAAFENTNELGDEAEGELGAGTAGRDGCKGRGNAFLFISRPALVGRGTDKCLVDAASRLAT